MSTAVCVNNGSLTRKRVLHAHLGPLLIHQEHISPNYRFDPCLTWVVGHAFYIVRIKNGRSWVERTMYAQQIDRNRQNNSNSSIVSYKRLKTKSCQTFCFVGCNRFYLSPCQSSVLIRQKRKQWCMDNWVSPKKSSTMMGSVPIAHECFWPARPR